TASRLLGEQSEPSVKSDLKIPSFPQGSTMAVLQQSEKAWSYHQRAAKSITLEECIRELKSAGCFGDEQHRGGPKVPSELLLCQRLSLEGLSSCGQAQGGD